MNAGIIHYRTSPSDDEIEDYWDDIDPPIEEAYILEALIGGLGAKTLKTLLQVVLNKLFNSFGAGEPNRAARAIEDSKRWKLGGHKSELQWSNRMSSRGWTEKEISDTIRNGSQFKAVNKVNPGNTATEYRNLNTNRYVVIDDKTKEILQVSGKNFKN